MLSNHLNAHGGIVRSAALHGMSCISPHLNRGHDSKPLSLKIRESGERHVLVPILALAVDT